MTFHQSRTYSPNFEIENKSRKSIIATVESIEFRIAIHRPTKGGKYTNYGEILGQSILTLNHASGIDWNVDFIMLLYCISLKHHKLAHPKIIRFVLNYQISDWIWHIDRQTNDCAQYKLIIYSTKYNYYLPNALLRKRPTHSQTI